MATSFYDHPTQSPGSRRGSRFSASALLITPNGVKTNVNRKFLLYSSPDLSGSGLVVVIQGGVHVPCTKAFVAPVGIREEHDRLDRFLPSVENCSSKF